MQIFKTKVHAVNKLYMIRNSLHLSKTEASSGSHMEQFRLVQTFVMREYLCLSEVIFGIKLVIYKASPISYLDFDSSLLNKNSK